MKTWWRNGVDTWVNLFDAIDLHNQMEAYMNGNNSFDYMLEQLWAEREGLA